MIKEYRLTPKKMIRYKSIIYAGGRGIYFQEEKGWTKINNNFSKTKEKTFKTILKQKY